MHYGTRVIIIIIRRRIYVQRGLQLQDYWPWCTAVVVNKVIIFLDKIHLLPTDGLPSQSAKSIYYVPAIIHQNLLTCFSGKKQWRFQRGIIFTKTYDDVSSNTKENDLQNTKKFFYYNKIIQCYQSMVRFSIVFNY